MKHIFVSSTFRDMHEERDIIHEKVLPELNEYALQYGRAYRSATCAGAWTRKNSRVRRAPGRCSPSVWMRSTAAIRICS